jgi:hypothetical protein
MPKAANGPVARLQAETGMRLRMPRGKSDAHVVRFDEFDDYVLEEYEARLCPLLKVDDEYY